MQTLAIIGSQGGLATALHKKFSEEYIVECFGKEQYNLTDVNDIDKLSEKISKFDVITKESELNNKNLIVNDHIKYKENDIIDFLKSNIIYYDYI